MFSCSLSVVGQKWSSLQLRIFYYKLYFLFWLQRTRYYENTFEKSTHALWQLTIYDAILDFTFYRIFEVLDIKYFLC